MSIFHVLLGAASYLTAAAVFIPLAVAQSPSAQPTSCPLEDFSTFPFCLNGDTEITGDGRLKLTDEVANQAGSAFALHTFADTVNYPFEASFEYDITDTGVGGSADGIAFVMHVDPAGPTALNADGGAMGVYGNDGIHCALVVELDTYFGPSNFGPEAPFSSVDYTRAIDIITTDDVGNAERFIEIDVTSIFTLQGMVWISYDDGVLDVYLSSSSAKPATPTVSVSVDVATIFNNGVSDVYVGFSSSTGGEYDKHEIISFSFEESTAAPTSSPMNIPTFSPTLNPSATPTRRPTKNPTAKPSAKPTNPPTRTPSATPTKQPTQDPTISPSANPVYSPTWTPSAMPTKRPNVVTTKSPTNSAIAPPLRCEDDDDDDDDSKGKGKGKGGSKEGKGGSKSKEDDDDDDDSSKGKGKGKGGSKGGSKSKGDDGSGSDDDDSKGIRKLGKGGSSKSKGDDDDDDSCGSSKTSKGTKNSKSGGGKGKGKGGKRQLRTNVSF